MLKKAINCKMNWDLFLPHVLCAYRQTPHSITGFSPFQLIYGVNVRGPLEVLRDNWLEAPVIKLVERVENIKLNLCDFNLLL